jgi:hypothetical protein
MSTGSILPPLPHLLFSSLLCYLLAGFTANKLSIDEEQWKGVLRTYSWKGVFFAERTWFGKSIQIGEISCKQK